MLTGGRLDPTRPGSRRSSTFVHRVFKEAIMASTASAMLDTYPADLGRIDRAALARCIEACLECSQACTACADACLSEPAVADLATCIRSNLDCADICDTTGRVLSRHTGYDANLTRAVLQACAQACRS